LVAFLSDISRIHLTCVRVADIYGYAVLVYARIIAFLYGEFYGLVIQVGYSIL